jgi:hypothetical protein
MRATPECPSMFEWFAPGTEPQQPDTWQHNGRTVLPAEYAEWSARDERGNVILASSNETPGVRHILSPKDGDELERPVGLDPRYATIPLIAADGDNVRWSVDGAALHGTRWQIAAGTHIIRATWPNGARDSVRVRVY